VLFALAGLATPAAAAWRDFMGKTLVVEVQTGGRTVNDVIKAKGGADENDVVRNDACKMTYRLYLSTKGRLFMFLSHIACVGSDPYDYDAFNGSIFDLTVPEGKIDAGKDTAPTPYRVKDDGDEVVIDQPQTDYVWHGSGYISTISNASGNSATRIRFADDCSMSVEGQGGYRMEFQSTDSDYYSLQDTNWTYELKTVSCRVVDGFSAK
jgi:hypothetical protein